MKEEQVSKIIGNIDEKYIKEATEFAYENGVAPAKRPVHINRGLVAAAAAVIVILLGTAVFAITAEAKDYSDAVAFFRENGLSTEGLSRAEVKAVYHDITTKSFTYGKTAEVILRTVPGIELETEKPNSAELAVLWENKNRQRDIAGYGTEQGSVYNYGFDYIYGGENGNEFKGTAIKCYKEGELLWSSEFTGFYYAECDYTEKGTIAKGSGNNAKGYSSAAVALLDDKGAVIWERNMDHGFTYEYLVNAFLHPDGMFDVIIGGYEDQQTYLCFVQLDENGNETYYKQTLIGQNSLGVSARLGDDYLVRVSAWYESDPAHIFRIDRNGDILGEYSYTAGDKIYYILDMIEFGGKVYMSAYELKVQNENGEKSELEKYLDEILKDGAAQVLEDGRIIYGSPEKLGELVRANATAALLLCDAGNVTPVMFYSVKGAKPGTLSVNGQNRLAWRISVIGSIYYKPLSSSDVFDGPCKVYDYIFGEDGTLLEQKDTGLISSYYGDHIINSEE